MRPATPLICQFIDEHKGTYGVVPICRALAVRGVQIAPRKAGPIKLTPLEAAAEPRNLRRNPRVALSIADQENPYASASIRGRVVEMTHEGADGTRLFLDSEPGGVRDRGSGIVRMDELTVGARRYSNIPTVPPIAQGFFHGEIAPSRLGGSRSPLDASPRRRPSTLLQDDPAGS